MPKTNSGRYGTCGGKAAKRQSVHRGCPLPRRRGSRSACTILRAVSPRHACYDHALTTHSPFTLAGEIHKDSLAADYGKFVEELQRVLALKWRRVFKIFPQVVCWVDAAQKDKYEVWYKESLRTNETTAEDWARDPIGQCDYSVALMFRGTFGHSSAAAHTPASMGNGLPKLWRERSVLGFHRGFIEAAKRGSTTAEVWVNKQIREPNIDGRCVELTLDRLQTLVEDGIDWDEFEMVNTR
ncbi:hypothetical protein B0H11DRAFT_1937478 [Mycena galericulata]|nr:hypothetical protein B0H11DRAFT_1937478 [Mycena galericulata]